MSIVKQSMPSCSFNVVPSRMKVAGRTDEHLGFSARDSGNSGAAQGVKKKGRRGLCVPSGGDQLMGVIVT